MNKISVDVLNVRINWKKEHTQTKWKKARTKHERLELKLCSHNSKICVHMTCACIVTYMYI